MRRFMVSRFLCCVVIALGLEAQMDPFEKRIEQTLEAVMQWEILWTDSPKGFRAHDSGPVSMAIYAKAGSVSYCSHEAGVCVSYKVSGYRNWEGTRSSILEDDRSDKESLISFVGGDAGEAPISGNAAHTLGPGGLSGVPAASSGILWATKIMLRSRAEVVREYRQMHPRELEALRKWLIGPRPDRGDASGITIACFAATDPMVYYYVEQPADPLIMSVFWNRESEEWSVAGSLQRSQNPARFSRLHSIIDSIACSGSGRK
jgi:hypothetical protein